ncbi:hypothetical protein QUA03_27510 [Microcoleus sp. S36b_A4]|uniref:hypothetical protein n=1 Tax=Microcoleus sp. S36b_A4 TaxID=3055420 RepID=UPI002FD344C2
MTIPLVRQGLIELDDGKVFELDSARGAAWLESIGSFRFEPSADNKPYTVRKEASKGGDYWYGYRKQNGKLHKRYIGKSSELSTAKLEEIAEALNTPPQPRVTDKVTEVTDTINQLVTGRVTDTVTIERFTALELQVQLLQESLEALRSKLPGKSDAGNFEELPTVTDTGLQIEIGNLKAENERLQGEYDKLLASSHIVTEKLREEVREVRSQLETERADREEVEAKLAEREEQMRQLLSELAASKQNSEIDFDCAAKAGELVSWLRKEVGKGLPKQVTVKAVQKILEGGDN